MSLSNIRLEKAVLYGRNIQVLEVDLFDKYDLSNDKNYYSIIIGNNGTGKSRILSGVANYFIERKPKNYRVHVEHSSNPNKVIALTNTITDKFPIDNSMRRRNAIIGHRYEDELYTYLGNRNKTFGFSSRALISRALDIIFQTYESINNRASFTHIFNYLDYEPILRVHCRIRHDKIRNFINSQPSNLFNDTIFEEYIKEQVERTDYNEKYYQDLISESSIHVEEVIAFLNDFIALNKKEISIDLSFSESRISFSERSEYLFEDNKLKTYRLLSTLQRIGLVGTYDIRLISNQGVQFRFDEASSGETNILSSMLALAALVRDNSVILIDEPEISLHPYWQHKYMDLLRQTLSHVKGCHIVIATHSHFILSDSPESDSCIIAMNKSSNGFISSQLVKQDVYNQSADYILLHIFGIPTARNWYLRQAITEGLEILAEKDKDILKLKLIKMRLEEFYPRIKDDDPLKKLAKILLDYEIRSNG